MQTGQAMPCSRVGVIVSEMCAYTSLTAMLIIMYTAPVERAKQAFRGTDPASLAYLRNPFTTKSLCTRQAFIQLL